ncbi:MAG: hypothetical protein QGG34_05015 [SAR202 cluster bacterium]|nr:hypothetical protein [SAR202 cluster bacterium]MDP6302871.1 hypothetical protein [SAR202 cluster bacterium]MDP7103861.1 hypothetical protein [SAR202 cluster bacterium]MDP7226904.1 hypothetical protein [SAR202 cluster bacterium]MDP7413812.1 hypothetical protein [SAR202 cluster bacterium]
MRSQQTGWQHGGLINAAVSYGKTTDLAQALEPRSAEHCATG